MRIVLLGAPGSGKGTQASLLQSIYGLRKISTGDLLRNEVMKSTPVGWLVEPIIKRGGLVPDDAVMEVLKGHLATEGVKDNFVLDGFPRSYNQAVTLDSMLGEFGVKLDKAVFLTVDDSKVIDRITGRYHCRSCGSIYNLLYSLPKQQGICDVCGGKNFSIRDDDNKDVVRSRLKTYRESIAGVVDYYRETGILLQVDGDKHLEQVSLAIINGLGL